VVSHSLAGFPSASRQPGLSIRLSRAWWRALNPAIYLVSILPGAGVWQLLRPSGTALAILLIATLAVVLLQHAVNLLNDVTDWRLGADEEKWNSWVHVHDGDLQATRWHGGIAFAAGLLLALLAAALGERVWLFAYALPWIGLGYFYNEGEPPLSYSPMGEWVTGLCYGPGVFGCLWLVTGAGLAAAPLLGALAFGCLAASVLLSHQPPQIETDRLAGKQSFAVRHGEAKTRQAARALLLVFLTSWAAALWLGDVPGLAGYLAGSALVFAGSWRARFGPGYLLLSTSGLLLVSMLLAA